MVIDTAKLTGCGERVTTVGELIEALKRLPEDAEVFAFTPMEEWDYPWVALQEDGSVRL